MDSVEAEDDELDRRLSKAQIPGACAAIAQSPPMIAKFFKISTICPLSNGFFM